MMGVVDVKFNKQATKVAVSSLDSMIRVWDIDTSSGVVSGRRFSSRSGVPAPRKLEAELPRQEHRDMRGTWSCRDVRLSLLLEDYVAKDGGIFRVSSQRLPGWKQASSGQL